MDWTATMSDMNEGLKEIVETLGERFEADIYAISDEASLVVKADQIVDVCQALRDEFDFEMLVAQSAVDYWPQQTPRFHVIYRLRSLEHNLIIGLRVPLDGNSPTIPTVEGLYRNANWFEREIWDMFGIQIDGHSDPRRILMPHDWQGHPLRKDYPLGYEEVQFSFNFDEIDRRKPHAKE
jgi:NADH-quinone oxidoreductase subunit C